jgi:hypothetical protein
MKVEHSGGVKAMTDQQLEAAIETITAMLAARNQGAGAQVIEGEALPALPAPLARSSASLERRPRLPHASRRAGESA